MEKTIYDLKISEGLTINVGSVRYDVLCVPGGFIYVTANQSIFIPYEHKDNDWLKTTCDMLNRCSDIDLKVDDISGNAVTIKAQGQAVSTLVKHMIKNYLNK